MLLSAAPDDRCGRAKTAALALALSGPHSRWCAGVCVKGVATIADGQRDRPYGQAAGRRIDWPARTVRTTRNSPEDVRQPGFIVLRLIAELVLLPFRLAVGLAGLIIALGGALGAFAWTIQLLIGGSGDGPLAPGLMWLTCAAAVPAGLTLLALATAGVLNDPPAQEAESDSTGDTPPAPKRWEQLAPVVLSSGTGLTVREIPVGAVDDYLAALNEDPDLERVYRPAPAPYHRSEPPRLRAHTSRRPL